MFCPNNDCPDFLDTGLRAEYRDDVEVCPYCDTPLVAVRPEAPAAEPGDLPAKPRVADDEPLEAVIETDDPTEVTIIKSILDGAGIPFVTRGESRFGAFRGAYVSGSIFNPQGRGVIFAVPNRMADEARHLLEELEDAVEDESDFR